MRMPGCDLSIANIFKLTHYQNSACINKLAPSSDDGFSIKGRIPPCFRSVLVPGTASHLTNAHGLRLVVPYHDNRELNHRYSRHHDHDPEFSWHHIAPRAGGPPE